MLDPGSLVRTPLDPHLSKGEGRGRRRMDIQKRVEEIMSAEASAIKAVKVDIEKLFM